MLEVAGLVVHPGWFKDFSFPITFQCRLHGFHSHLGFLKIYVIQTFTKPFKNKQKNYKMKILSIPIFLASSLAAQENLPRNQFQSLMLCQLSHHRLIPNPSLECPFWDELDKAKGLTIAGSLADIPGVSQSTYGPNANQPIIRGADKLGSHATNGTDTFGVSAQSEDQVVPIDPLLLIN